MSTVSIIRKGIEESHNWFEQTMADVTPEMADYQPGGTAHPIGSRYAHMVAVEDMFIHIFIRRGNPLFATTWEGKTGIPNPQDALNTTLEWAQSVKIDLPALRQYAQTVYQSTDAYLASLKDEDLEDTIDLSEQGIGKITLGAFLLNFVYGHIRDIMGEVSTIKGIQGAQGYPF